MATRLVIPACLLYRLSCKGEPALTMPREDPPEWLAAHINAGYSTPVAIIDGNCRPTGPGGVRRNLELAAALREAVGDDV